MNVAGTRALVLPPELLELEPPGSPAPPVGFDVVVVFVAGFVVVLERAVVVVFAPLVAGAVAVAIRGAVGFEVRVLVVACVELPQPANSASAAKLARIRARELKDCCITADIEGVDEA